jgi:hypothetical protein
MRQCANRKGVFIDGVSIPKKPRDEVSRSHVVREVAEKLFAERVVAHVLYGTPTVGIGMRFPQLPFRGIGKTHEQERPNRIVPRQVNQLFVRKNRIRGGVYRDKRYH